MGKEDAIRIQWNTAAAAKSLQSCPTLCEPIDGSPPGSSVPGILQARTVEWAAISFSRNRIEGPELTQEGHGQLIFNKSAKNLQ